MTPPKKVPPQMEARCEPLVFILISLALYPLFGVVGVCAALLFFLIFSIFRCVYRLAAPAPARSRRGGAGQGVLGPAAGVDLQQQHDAQRDVILALCATLPLADAVALRALVSSGGDGARDGADYAGLQLLDTLWGSRATGAPPPLATAAVDALSSRPGTPSDGPCAVCLDPVAPSQPVTALPCLHVFHAHCIRTWLLESAACPVCRFKFVESA